MNIARRYRNTQYHSVFITGSMCFVGKLPFMLPLHKHAAIRIRGGYSLFSACAAWGWIIVAVIFDWRFAQFLSFLIYLLAKLLRVDFGCLCYLLFLVFLLVCAGFDVGSIYEDRAGIYHPVIQRFVQDMLENLTAQFLRKPLAERITHRRKVRDLVQQTIP